MIDVKSIGSKREEYPEITIGEKGSSPSTTSDEKSLVSKAEGYTETVKCKMDSSETEIVDGKMDSSGTEIVLKAPSEGAEHTETVDVEMALGGSASFDAMLVSEGETYTNIPNGEKIPCPCATTTHDVKSTVSEKRSNQASEVKKPMVDENLNSESIMEDMETAAVVMHTGGTASIDANDEASRKRKRQVEEHKKAAVGIILNPNNSIEDNEIANNQQTMSIEGLPEHSHFYGDQQMESNMVRSLYAKLTIGNEEISNDQNLGASALKDFNDHHGVQLMRTPVATSRKKLLILDVNGLLADIISPPPKDRKSDKNISRRAIFKRPFLDDFLGFCFKRFDVAIWSSRTRKILRPVVDYLLGDLKKQLLFVWDLSQCTNSSARSLENKHKFIVFKELRRIWEQDGTDLAFEKGYYDETNTLLLDDSPYKALLNPKHTGIFPLSYSYKDMNDNYLGPDGDLRVYLEGVATSEDVQMYVKQRPFGQPAIDETSPHWHFYSGVLEAHLVKLSSPCHKRF